MFIITANLTPNKLIKDPQGFTLIELLVVITIISILAVIGLIAYSSFLKKSRDSKRQSDLKFIQSALEDYHSDKIYYPAIGTGSCLADGLFRLGCSLAIGSKIYITQIPDDPTSGQHYFYMPINCDNTSQNCTNYCLYALLENLTTPTTEDATNCPVPSSSVSYNYAVTKP